MRTLKLSECKIKIKVRRADTPVRGNASACGDAEIDREIEDAILARTSPWAWAYVEVTVSWKRWSSMDWLCCSRYKNEADFRQDRDFTDLCETALDDLNYEISECADALKGLKD